MNDTILPAWLDDDSDTAKIFYKEHYLHARPENGDIEVPPDVSSWRDVNEILHTVRQINENTRTVPGFLKTLQNIFNFGASEMEPHIPDRLKKKKK